MNNKVIVTVSEGTPYINASPQGLIVELKDFDTTEKNANYLQIISDEENQIQGTVKDYDFSSGEFDETQKINESFVPLTTDKTEIEGKLGREISEEEFDEIKKQIIASISKSFVETLNKFKNE
jgi:hypothetical protein